MTAFFTQVCCLKENISLAKFAFHSVIAIGDHSLDVNGILSLSGLSYWVFVVRPKDQRIFANKENTI